MCLDCYPFVCNMDENLVVAFDETELNVSESQTSLSSVLKSVSQTGNDSICSIGNALDIRRILEGHDNYLQNLVNSDSRYRPKSPRDIVYYPCQCGNHCNTVLSILDICQQRMRWPIDYNDRVVAQFFEVKRMTFDTEFVPIVKSCIVCLDYYSSVQIFPIERLRRFVDQVLQGLDQPLFGTHHVVAERITTCENLAKVALFADEHFEPSPSSNALMVPSRWTKASSAGNALAVPLKKRRKTNFTKFFTKLTKKSHFISGNTLVKCNLCTSYAFKLRKLTLSPEERKEIKTAFSEHRQKIRDDRRDYALRAEASREHPDEYLSLVHDGMSKHSTKLPLLHDHRSKSVDDNDRIFCGLNLVLLHRKSGGSLGTSIGFFSVASSYDNTTNSIISQILAAISQTSPIPPTVCIQVDNFAANKSYVFFATFAYILLRQCVIKEFYISFMLPGHTHCDVDAKFGNFATFLKTKECGSPQELMQEFVECFHGLCSFKQSIYHFKEKLHPYCVNYGSVSSIYDFHLFIDSKGIPMVENARFQLSSTYVCGSRQDETAFISPVFKEIPPLDLSFRLSKPNIETIDKIPGRIERWKNVISTQAVEHLLSLKNEILSYVGTPFEDLIKGFDHNSSIRVLAQSANDGEVVSSNDIHSHTTTGNLLSFVDSVIGSQP